MIRLLKSPRLALAVLVFLAFYGCVAAWLPAALAALGIDHPFRAAPFLAAWGLLFFSTLACTWARSGPLLRLWRGEPPAHRARLEAVSRAPLEELLRRNGFRPLCGRLFRARPALWGGFVLHVGLLLLMAGVAVEQLFHEGGNFEVAEGETVRLRREGTVFQRVAGPLAASRPPAFELTLGSFDPYLHQPGYAPDRSSTLLVARDGEPPRELKLDRAAGVRLGWVVFYQAIPVGLALTLEVPGLGLRSVHLRRLDERTGEQYVTDPEGATVRFAAEAARALTDPRGTGELRLTLLRSGEEVELVPGQSFPFGGRPARLVGVTRWGGFTYAVSPGMPAVYAGFAVLLSGCLLLLLPAGVARIEETPAGAVCHLTLNRGLEAMEEDWRQLQRAAGPASAILSPAPGEH